MIYKVSMLNFHSNKTNEIFIHFIYSQNKIRTSSSHYLWICINRELYSTLFDLCKLVQSKKNLDYLRLKQNVYTDFFYIWKQCRDNLISSTNIFSQLTLACYVRLKPKGTKVGWPERPYNNFTQQQKKNIDLII